MTPAHITRELVHDSISKDSLSLLKQAYRFCRYITRGHYENFPVASLLIPKKFRSAITVIYAFGRSADDIADEGDLPVQERLKQLEHYENRLQNTAEQRKNSTVKEISEINLEAKSGVNAATNSAVTLEINSDTKNEDLIFIALQEVIHRHQLPKQLFFDQLSAFKQDITKDQYQNFNELTEYCQRSACPIGRLLLYLTQTATALNLYYSDCICTAIQVINFLQDLESDLHIRHRCYLPLDNLKTVGLSIEQLKTEPNIAYSDKLHAVIKLQLLKVEHLLNIGKPLVQVLKGRLGFELRLTFVCAYKMVEKLKQRRSAFERPTLRAFEWPFLLIKTLFFTGREF